jgi:hypothetical protein
MVLPQTPTAQYHVKSAQVVAIVADAAIVALAMKQTKKLPKKLL